jgi:hypothetical protein
MQMGQIAHLQWLARDNKRKLSIGFPVWRGKMKSGSLIPPPDSAFAGNYHPREDPRQ